MKGHAAMNRIYRLVWSVVRGAWLAVAECARGRGKAGRRVLPLILCLLACVAQAAP